MTAEIIFRAIGFILFGIIGWQLGTIWAGTTELNSVSLRYIIPLTLLSGILGAIIMPPLITKPAHWIRRVIGELTIVQLVSGSIGLVLGLIVAALLAVPLSYLPSPFRSILPTIVAIVFGYIGVTIMVQRQKEIVGLFRRRGGAPLIEEGMSASEVQDDADVVLLDTSVIIDGRIADIVQTGFLRSTVVIPRFVLAELQYIADSADALRRNRGRRGLEMLNRMQRESPVPVKISDMDVEGVRQVDAKLVQLARQISCPIVTNDYNLNRVAGLQGVQVLNINDLSNAVRAAVLPGEPLSIRVIQEGKEVGQGIGYLEDGTMVVVENGRRFMDSEIAVTVTKVLQTSAGRMIFASPAD
jgi:uncharacterized protein YacL